MTGPRRALVKRTSRKKGATTVLAGVATVMLFAFSYPILGVVGLAGTGYLGYGWLRHRANWGLRF